MNSTYGDAERHCSSATTEPTAPGDKQMGKRDPGVLYNMRRVVRYVRLYGPARTLAKVKGERHYLGRERAFNRIDAVRSAHEQSVGIIGCGKFAFTTVAYFLQKNEGGVIRGVMDIDPKRANSLASEYGAAYWTTNAQEIMDDEQISTVYIASNHRSHAEYAIMALERGKCVHIEKPHVVDRVQLDRLCRALALYEGRAEIGFNRPDSLLGRRVRQAYLGDDGPGMINWFVAGHAIRDDHWYYNEAEGGRVLGNLCHWTDFIYRMVPAPARYPIRIVPTRWEKRDNDIIVTYTFGDGTMAVISFSAKGRTFEGVRERLSAHRGDTLISLQDFRVLTVDRGERRTRTIRPFRDHGHEARIMASYRMEPYSVEDQRLAALRYVWESADLFLSTREALSQEAELVLNGFTQSEPYGPDAAS